MFGELVCREVLNDVASRIDPVESRSLGIAAWGTHLCPLMNLLLIELIGKVNSGFPSDHCPLFLGLGPSTRGRCCCHLLALPEPSGFCHTAPWRTRPPHSAALTVSATFLASQNCHGTENCSIHLPTRTVRRPTASLGPTAVSSVGGAIVTQGAWSTTAGPTRLAFSPVPPVARTSPIPWPSRAT